MKRHLYDDGFNSFLVKDAIFVGDAGIPVLPKMKNLQIPKALIPYSKSRRSKNKQGFVHFYQHDKEFRAVLNNPKKFVEHFKQYDGIISPDPTMFIDNSRCLLETSTYMNRAIALFYARKGIPVIPNIRWTNEKSYDFCFLGVPQETIVSVSTHGCCRSKEQKERFKHGLSKMLEVLKPSDVLVHGYMPKVVFEDFEHLTKFHRYPSDIERAHTKKV